ncbi:MAG: hypothetical protein P4L57_00175 [Rhizomicrobium sp.]|nr:hypothetical protein [Rhizomicrobium sp.]
MNADDMVERVCFLPVDSRVIGTLSPRDLVKRTGYPQATEALTVDSVEGVLRRHPELLKEWEIWSDDKCTPTSWIFQMNPDGCTVYFHPVGESMVFADPFVACAEYIVRELRWIKAISDTPHGMD